ncbi:hypothetical protein IWQ60_006902 [Tieghemiomyces parasiticus]|uniref:SWI5-dependent HO expression protein 3 n=1 Tax=Tieghemiomyces parasiticus TaxID=78921 RepID=A0A9W8A1I4_9FUNG|nr:hypothetical protein IWQ60_006902 [Tieghemiomyces parasiticus]
MAHGSDRALEGLSPHSYDGYDDPSDLRAALASKERDLDMAAQIGLSLAEQNRGLQLQLEQTARFSQDLAERADTDRRLFLDRSLQMDDVVQRVHLLETTAQDQVQVNQALETRLQAVRTENRTLREDLRSLTVHFAEIEASHGKTTHSSLKALHKLHSLETTLEQERIHLADTRNQLAHLADRATSQGNNFGTTLRALQDNLSKVCQNLDDLRGEMVELQSDRQDVDAAVRQDIQDYRSLLDDARATIENLLELHAMQSEPSNVELSPPSLDRSLAQALSSPPLYPTLAPRPWPPALAASPTPSDPGTPTDRPSSPLRLLPSGMLDGFGRPPAQLGLRMLNYYSRGPGR